MKKQLIFTIELYFQDQRDLILGMIIDIPIWWTFLNKIGLIFVIEMALLLKWPFPDYFISKDQPYNYSLLEEYKSIFLYKVFATL